MPSNDLNRWLKRLYLAGLAVMVFTGFGQMPIFKRYYINELPGLGWTANFYATVQVHYLTGAILLAVAAFTAVDFLLVRRAERRLTRTGWVRGLLLAGILATGLIMLIKNLGGVIFSHGFLVAVNLSHLALVMSFLFFALGCLVTRAKWTRPV